MKIVILGANGQLGKCFNDQFTNTRHEIIYLKKIDLNVCDFNKTKKKLTTLNPDLVINSSAYTDVDNAEKNEKLANNINYLAVENIANICMRIDSWLIHISTDYVFDGTSNSPYKESDRVNPQGVYGNTKLNGEKSIQTIGCKHIIFRTSWVFSEYGKNFIKTMIQLGLKREEIKVVNDQIGCPTYAQDIAKAIVSMVSKIKSDKKSCIYHYCGNEPCTWYDFAKVIFDEAKSLDMRTPKILTPIQTCDYPTLAKRPAYSVLNCYKIKSDYGILESNWRHGIKNTLVKLK